MRTPLLRIAREQLRDRRGVAFPITLFALLITAVLMAAVMVSSATEAAMSTAHQDAARSLYRTEAAIEALVQSRAWNLAAGTFPAPSDPAIQLRVSRLSYEPAGAGDVARSTFSITGEPVEGARRISVLVRTNSIQFDLESAATFGGDSELNGSGEVSDGRNSQSCDASERGRYAITRGRGTNASWSDQHTTTGDSVRSDLSGEALVTAALGGNSIQSLIPMAEKRFGTHASWTPSSVDHFVSNQRATSIEWSSGSSATLRALGHTYNWRCPGMMDTTDGGGRNCATHGADTTYFPIIAIDARGSQVSLQGDHGQGLLLIFNGGLDITGGFIFKGIIASEGDIALGGSGNRIEGAILSQNNVRLNPSTSGGSDILTFNRCAIRSVVQQINSDNPSSSVSRTFGWVEHIQ